jgi:Amidohydrolase
MPIVDINTLFGFWPRDKVDLSVDVLVGAMRSRQVARSAAYSAKALLYDAGEGNDDTATVCAGHSELIPAAVIDPRQFPRCLDEVRKRRDQGFRLFRFFPDRHGYPLDFAPLDALLPEMAGGVALFATARPGAATELARRVATEGLSLVLDPCGTDTLGEALAAMQTAPTLYLETTALLAAGALDTAAQCVNASRLLFGSGSPLLSLSSALMTLQFAGFTDADRAAVLGGNLEGLLSGK